MEKTMDLDSVGKRARKCDRCETGRTVRSNQVQRLDYIKYFNVRSTVVSNWLLTASLNYEIKRCGVVTSFYRRIR